MREIDIEKIVKSAMDNNKCGDVWSMDDLLIEVLTQYHNEVNKIDLRSKHTEEQEKCE